MTTQPPHPVHPRLYHEIQRFGQWWMWLVLSVPAAMMLWGVYIRFVLNQPFGHVGPNPAPMWLDVLMFIVIGAGMPFFFYLLRLEVVVQHDGLYYKFHTLHWRWHHIHFEEMKNATAKTYHPIMEYGGWGIRYGANGKAYNVSGNEGVLIELTNGKTIMFGSRRMFEFESVVKEYLQRQNRTVAQ